MIRQQPLTLISPVKNAEIDKLNLILLTMRDGLENGVTEEFEKLGTIHYLRLVILNPYDADGNVFENMPTRLVLSTDYDGEEEQHLNELITKAPGFVDKLYNCCEGYPAIAERTAYNRVEYLKKGITKSAAFFAGAPGRSLEQIKKESDLRNYIWHLIQSNNWMNKSAAEIHKTVKENVFTQSQFEWAKQKVNLPKENWLGMALLGVILLILLPFVIIWIIVLHFVHEIKDKPLGLTPSQVNPEKKRKL